MPTALSIRQVEGKPGQVYYPLQLSNYNVPTLKENELHIRITAFALNHRDLFVRQHLYPGVAFGVPLCADGCGVVVATGSSSTAKKWQDKRVIINPGTGWKDDVAGPEDPTGYKILGGTKLNPVGTAVTDCIVDAGEVEPAPDQLSSIEAAALPLTGLTAWRATMVKAPNAMAKGKNILITGIGGGVALMALMYAVAAGANVYVTSGSQEKLDRAVKMGAKGGVSYKEEGWDKKLRGMLPKERNMFDAIIDGAGGDVVEKAAKIVKAGGVVSVYGMTIGPKMPFLMSAVLKNIEVKGSTMGSRKEFSDMVRFVNDNNLKPVVSDVAKGIDNIKDIDGLFEQMKNSSQFGKLVVEVEKEDKASKL